ncbi:hypothetical protein Ate01nite_57940 [Actinoplanes teichomyceticus]|nr:hypothetical protein Ate01nite_57940 [Actinoplanes teichomyceticus]
MDMVTTTGVRIVRYAPSWASAIATISRAGASGAGGTAVVVAGRDETVVIAHLDGRGEGSRARPGRLPVC